MRRRGLLLCLPLLLLALGAAAWLATSGQGPSAPLPGTAPTTTEPTAEHADDKTPTARRRVGAAAASPDATAPADAVLDVPAPAFGLRVLTERDGRAIAGLVVRVGSDQRRTTVTNASGRAEIEPLAGELTLEVETDAPGAERLTLVPGETVVQVPAPVPLTMRFVSQETGAWTQGSAFVFDDAKPQPTQVLHGAPLWPGRAYDLRLDGQPLEPFFVAPRRDALLRSGTLSRYATAAEITLPLPHRTAATVRVRDPRGAPVEGVRVTIHHHTGVWRNATTGSDGNARIDGLPFYRRAALTAYASLNGREAETVTLLQEDLAVEPVIDLLLPDEVADSVIGVGGGSSSHFIGRGSGRRSTASGTAALVIRVLRRNGRPASGAYVGVAGPWRGSKRTDATGTAQFTGLPGGAYDVYVREHGLTSMTEHVELGAGETRRIELQEPPGRRLHVRVVDATGRGVPLAHVEVRTRSGTPWVPFRGDVQLLDLHTDRHGELRLEGVAPDAAVVVATYGGRRARKQIADDGIVTVGIPD